MATFSVKVHAKADGSTWTDISGDVLYENKVRIRYGASDQGSRIDTGYCSFRLNNDSDDYTPGNPEGTYYPNLGIGTQFRVSVEHGDVGLAMQEDTTSSATTPDAAALDITGDIDVRVDASLWDWTTPDVGSDIDNVELIGKFAGSPNKSWFFAVRDGYLYFEWSADGTNTASATATELLRVPGSNPRMAVRATLDVDNGAAGKTVTFYRADTIDGPWEQVGSAVTTAGTTSIANSTAALTIGDATAFTFAPLPMGVFHKASVRTGIGGTEVANPDFTAQASGTTSFTDAAGRTWSLTGGAEITNRKVRFVGEAASFTPGRIDKTHKYVDVQLGGIMRRLGINDEVLKSPVYRDMTSPSRTDIVAYWPMEEGSDAEEFASPLAGSQPMTMSGEVTPAGYSSWGASSPIPTFETGFVWAQLPEYLPTGETSVRFFLAVPAGGVSASQQIVSIPTSGSAQQWRLILDTGGDLELRAYDNTGTQVLSSGVLTAQDLNGVQRMITLEFEEIGGVDTDWTVISTTVDALSGTTQTGSGTLAGYLFGRASGIKLGGGGDLGGTAFGHLTVADHLSAYSDSQGPIANWKTEVSGDRVIRLADEEEIPVYMSGVPTTTYQGGQGESDVLTLLRDVAATEYGMIGESRERLGLFYRSPDSLSFQKPVAELTYTDGDDAPIVAPFEPVYDDDRLVNDFRASRRDGGFTRYEETDGRLSTSSPPTGAGRYEGGDTYNVGYEYLTGDLAGWAVHLGTFEGARFSTLRVRLDKKLSLVSALCKAYIGDIFEISGTPLDLAGTNKIKLRVEGYTEVIDQFEWVIDYVMSPGEPWDTGFAGYDSTAWQEEQFAWADTDGSELAEALTTTETDVDILTDASHPRWTSDAFDSPYDLKVGGEAIRVVAPGDLVNSNSLFASNVTGWEAVGSTLAHDTTTINPHPAAAGSLKITPDGVTATIGARSTHTAAGTINPGGIYQAGGWVYSATASTDMRMVIDWYDSADVLLSSSTGSASTLTANTWTYISQSLTAPTSASRAAVRVYRGGTPAASAVTYCWAVRITRAKASTVFDSFGRTSTDTWGSADSMQAWTNSGGAAADYDVLSGYGRHIHTAANVARHSTITSPHANTDIYCDVATAALSTGGTQYVGIVCRHADTSNYYEARAQFLTTGAISLAIMERVAGVEAQLGSTYTSALTHDVGAFVRIRFQVYGTALKAKIYAPAAEEPMTWHVETTDSSLSAAGSIGCRSIRSSTNTNANADMRFDNVDLITPQTFTVERSVNGVTKTHAAGADVRLAFPAIAGI